MFPSICSVSVGDLERFVGILSYFEATLLSFRVSLRRHWSSFRYVRFFEILIEILRYFTTLLTATWRFYWESFSFLGALSAYFGILRQLKIFSWHSSNVPKLLKDLLRSLPLFAPSLLLKGGQADKQDVNTKHKFQQTITDAHLLKQLDQTKW